MAKALMPYAGVFRAPLEIAAGEATLSWVKNDKGFMLDGRDIDVQAWKQWKLLPGQSTSPAV
ncbi:hypothetical protein CKQ90_28930 [Klebsiella pneumoniae]|nr:hypothetical protein CKQ90_28930 [Klebsiella pneumoniae]